MKNTHTDEILVADFLDAVRGNLGDKAAAECGQYLQGKVTATPQECREALARTRTKTEIVHVLSSLTLREMPFSA